MHFCVKKLNLDIFIHAPRQNSPPSSYYHLLGRGKFVIPQAASFWRSFPSKKGRSEETITTLQNLRKSLEQIQDKSVWSLDPNYGKKYTTKNVSDIHQCCLCLLAIFHHPDKFQKILWSKFQGLAIQAFWTCIRNKSAPVKTQ